jgi:hypothetical protein
MGRLLGQLQRLGVLAMTRRLTLPNRWFGLILLAIFVAVFYIAAVAFSFIPPTCIGTGC